MRNSERPLEYEKPVSRFFHSLRYNSMQTIEGSQDLDHRLFAGLQVIDCLYPLLPMLLYRLDKLLKQIVGIVGTGAGLWVILHREQR